MMTCKYCTLLYTTSSYWVMISHATDEQETGNNEQTSLQTLQVWFFVNKQHLNIAAISNVNTISIPVDRMDGHHHHHGHNHLGLQGHLPSTASTTSCYSTGSQWPHHWFHIVDKMRMLYEWLEVDSKLDWTASMSTHQSTNISKTH